MDGTKNIRGDITECVWAKTKLGNIERTIRYLVTSLGDQDVILGYSWLKEYNPTINWNKGTVLFEDTPKKISTLLRKIWIKPSPIPAPTIKEVPDESETVEPEEPTLTVEDRLSNLNNHELLISYLQGEDTFHVWMKDEVPLTHTGYFLTFYGL